MVHKQRFSVLLICSWMAYSGIYMLYYMSSNVGFVFDLSLLDISSSGAFSTSLIFDKISLSFSALVTFISACVFFFARSYMSSDLHYYRFMWVLLSFVLSMNMLILSGSFLTLLMGWDGLGVSSFALIIYYQSKDSWISGFLTLLINRLGDIIIMGLLFFFVLTGSTLLVNYPHTFQSTMLLLLAVGALTKSAQYPFSVWLPAAMAAPTPVSALVHSSTLVTAGIYIIIRATSTMNLPVDVMTLLLFCGGITSLLGGLCAVVENDIKKIIALSTLSQLGVMVFSLGLGFPSLALLHLYAHAMFKALLFLVAGAILMMSFGVQDIRLLGSVTRKAPILLVFMNISALCLMGLPFTSAFYSKHVIISLMWVSKVNMLSVIMMLLSTSLTGLYMIRLIKSMCWANSINTLVQPCEKISVYFPMVLLYIGSIGCGLLFNSMDNSLPVSFWFPSYNELFLTLITFMGVLMGCLLINRRKYSFLSNMFYLVPLWYSSPSCYYYLSTKVKWLDHGWLEPHSLSETTWCTVNNMHKLSSWPEKSLNILPFMVLFVGCSVLTWAFLK